MSRHSFFRLALATALAGALPAVPACSSDDVASSSSSSIADVVRQGDVTDSQLRTFLANEAQEWAWAGGRLDTPVDGGVLPSDAPFEFTWESDNTVDPPAAGATNDLQLVHLLVFSTQAEPNLLRVFSTLNSYTPDAATWETLKEAGQSGPITLSLNSATLMGSELVVDGGPFIGETVSFTIE